MTVRRWEGGAGEADTQVNPAARLAEQIQVMLALDAAAEATAQAATAPAGGAP